MKLSALFMFVALLTMQANTSYGQRTKLTLNLSNVSVEQLIDNIENSTEFRFVYKVKAVDLNRQVTINVKEELIEKVLETVFGNTSTLYNIIDRQIFLTEKKDLPIMGKPSIETKIIQYTITGKVVDELGTPLLGTTVAVKGTTRGTTTDFDGNYSLSLDGLDAILLFSFVGYVTQEIEVGNQTTINVKLLPDNAKLDEVVVVGYGTQKKSDVTGSVTSVAQERLDLVPNRNIAQVLQGALPGVTIRQTTAGAVGEQTIIVRGRNSILASNDPLIVLDGVPYYGDLNDISVNDIASMEVLKDASASAIYGSRGSNGVILITTKAGKTGKAKISYQGKFGIQEPINLPVFLTGREFYDFKSTRNAELLTDTEIANYEAGLETDWIDLSLRTGYTQSHNVSLTGGNDNTKYYIGGNFLDVKGLSVTDQYQRISGRVNIDTKITEWLDFGTRSQFTYDDRGGYNIDYEAVFEINPLLANPFDENGDINLFPWPEFPDENPLEAENYKDEDYSNQIVSNNYINVTFPFLKGLNYRLNTGIRRRWSERKTYAGSNTVVGIANSGQAYLSSTEFKNNVVENILTFNKEFGKHNVFLTGVYSYEENEQYFEELTAINFPNDEFTYFGISQASSIESQNDYQRTALISQMLRLNYSFNNTYLLTLTGRRDGFSGFGPDNKWGVFPSVALGWNISREPFLENSTTINQLKLRLSWGINGNQAVDPYSSITRLRDRNTLSGEQSLVGYVPSVIGDKDLGWESSETYNLGLDFGLFNNRVFGDLNLYETNTSDLLLNRTISSVHGINQVTQNIGETQTRGLELSLSVVPWVTQDFNWKISGNFATNKNKIVSLYGYLQEDGSEINDLANAWFVGEPIRVNFDQKMIGVWQLGEEEEAAVYDRVPGDAKIEDVDNNGVLDDKDRQIIGQRDPKYTWGLSNAFQYKNFGLEVFFIGSHGATRHNNLLRDNTAAEIRRNVLKKNWWTPDNPTNEYFRNNDQVKGGSIYEDASFVRLKDITVSYNFPKKVLSKIKLEKLQLFASGRNLLTITDWTAGDPELELPSSQAGILPLQREITFGLTLEF
ncbi:TonB-dependent receptor [Muricauda sp. 334s03]|uniref:TonB-dependent receptor n=1 Tax=Flagellimonas yonaguniensis TaxID=3031325 RepID=A0ABT5XVV3_9FLAO|nr:TonB-dependent receptor [[Muricauda] yonaguniensis]MDF0715314.1 TonB-dependent receptor [[Muricauda] yonaguniensis]